MSIWMVLSAIVLLAAAVALWIAWRREKRAALRIRDLEMQIAVLERHIVEGRANREAPAGGGTRLAMRPAITLVAERETVGTIANRSSRAMSRGPKAP